MSDKKPPSPLRQSLGELAPKLVDLTEDVLFGDVWERPQLSKRDRSLITCAALVATGKTEQMDFHFPNAIRVPVPLPPSDVVLSLVHRPPTIAPPLHTFRYVWVRRLALASLNLVHKQ